MFAYTGLTTMLLGWLMSVIKDSSQKKMTGTTRVSPKTISADETSRLIFFLDSMRTEEKEHKVAIRTMLSCFFLTSGLP